MDSCSSRRRLIPEASRGLRVLLVDEDTSSLRDIASVLDEQFYKVTTIELASVALSMIQRADQFDLVMADTNMRGMDIFTFLSGILLKTDMPVIFMSSNDNMDMARKALIEGACFFFQKPIREQDLINKYKERVIRINCTADDSPIHRTNMIEEASNFLAKVDLMIQWWSSSYIQNWSGCNAIHFSPNAKS
ncbi:Two-component response regulator ORR23 [Camellia lanceoleosa]|uniref:Two-component response regulator ORR23 n=1 Tax=Camellia lanceoleosa TaxID=1840588 RepID=A0ACC0GCE8_9ERIC|nr:Two-component response regulator ORR23 [Camellia lanceoleosa]